MGILYYPNEIQKKYSNRIDVQMREARTYADSGSQDLTGAGMTYSLSQAVPSWKVELVTMHFSGANAKNYSINVETGRGIITGLNDAIWIGVTGAVPQRIVLDQGFYSGTTLATELQSELNADSVFSGLGVTFTVSWDSATRLFTITPSAGTISYVDENTAQAARINSTSGHVLGFTADQSGASIVSDTAVPALGSKTAIVSETANTDTDVALTTEVALDVDSALSIDVSAVALTVDYSVKYRLTAQ